MHCRTLPILEAYYTLLDDCLRAYIAWHRAILKFCHILVTIVTNLAQDGFCKPVEEQASSSAQTEASEGTGMGVGKGEKNVSKDIEGQEQVEGLQNEAAQDDAQEDSNEETDHIDMNEDFAGSTESVSKDGEEDGKEQESQDEAEDDLQEEVGEIDRFDPAAVDVKFWQGNDADNEMDEKANKEASQQHQEKTQAEMGPKEAARSKADQKDQGLAINDKAEPDEADANDEPQEDRDAIQEPESVQHENGKPAEMPSLDAEAQALDLPNDLEMDAPPRETDGSDEEFELDAENEGNQSLQ